MTPIDTGDPRQPTVVMGIVNVTPDSFSDGGRFADTERAIEHGLLLAAQGAHVIDVGGESTRPGAEPVDPAVEASRVLPVVSELVARGLRVSIDTRHAHTAELAVAAGATIVNDVTGFVDPAMRSAAVGAIAVINHMPTDDPRTMQDHAVYDDVVVELREFFLRRIDECSAAGVTDIVLDPGIGFGKTTAHNLAVLGHLDLLAELGPLLVGVSRKRFVGDVGLAPATDDRLPGSIAAALAAVARGASWVRVHDVAAHVQALRLWHAVRVADEHDAAGTIDVAATQPTPSRRAMIAIGSNLGDREAYLRLAVDSLPGLVATSDVYETEPIGGPDGQGPFLNMVVAVDTTLDPYALLRRCQQIEGLAMRRREVRWGPRTLDVDLLFHGDARIDDDALQIPHPRLHERRFVLAPLSQIAPELCPPDWDARLPPEAVTRRGPLAGCRPR
jgi:dihydropteroate synthase